MELFELAGQYAQRALFVEQVLGQDEKGRRQEERHVNVFGAHPADGKNEEFAGHVVFEVGLLGFGKLDRNVLGADVH